MTAQQESKVADLLIEIGTEELPPGALNQLASELLKGLLGGLEKAQIPHDKAAARWYASPRRLACLVPAVAAQQPEREMERRGPAVAQAFKGDGEPTPAALGFARSVGVEIGDLQRLKTEKGEWLYHRFVQQGEALASLLPELMQKAVAGLPIPKPMRWGDYDTRFVRPVHWIVCLHGDEVLPLELLGQNAGRVTYGHRVHAPGEHNIPSPQAYLSVLESAYVLADVDRRRERVLQQSQAIAAAEQLTARLEPSLVDEVTALVEWPVAVLGSFDDDFLQVPAEALISSMEYHQKFFPLLKADGQLSAKFIAFANMESLAPERVRDGFERVVRPRLADAKFFWEQDLKHGLEKFQSMLENVVFQKKLGSLADKTRRVARLSGLLAKDLGLNAAAAERAAELARTDLMSEMVGEFPELQGIMGRYYALAAGESAEVAQAIDEHYQPRQSGDPIAAGDLGKVLAVAEKADTLVGIFAVGLKPTGAKDPFALRRAALGLMRTLIEGGMELGLGQLLQQAVAGLASQVETKDTLAKEVLSFILDRAQAYWREQGFSAAEIQAVTALNLDHPLDLQARVQAVKEFATMAQAESLSAANKRCANILRQAEVSGEHAVDQGRLADAAEQQLYQALQNARSELEQLLPQREYTQALARLAQLETPVNQFFDDVMVMAEDEALRNNRLALVAQLRQLFLSIADVSKLSG